MATAKIVTLGDSQYVLLPKEFETAAHEFEIVRGEGRSVVLTPRYQGLAEAVDIMRDFPEDMIEAVVELKRKDRAGV